MRKGLAGIIHKNGPSTGIAKFKYTRKHDIGKLYWMRSDMKWHSYKMPGGSKSLGALVKEVDTDPQGALFG
jgi:hypothetical protein